MNADVAYALELVLGDDRCLHLLSKSGRSDVASLEEGLVGRFIGPFAEKMGEASERV